MPARLIYSPKSYVYTKDASGTLHNLSRFVVSGEVTRLIDQVSTAQVTLRNPMKRFTTPAQGAPFHPMDPITIYLERVPGFPVRVFTGYLDTTPYYQMYPGTITLKASCTLKRLLYTFFDPSLPYMIDFLTQYGWINRGDGTVVSTQAFNTNKTANINDIANGKTPFNNLQDGSIGKLLWATLFNIGQWQDSNIWIEPLPTGATGIAARMAQLMKTIDKENKQAANELSTFLTQIVGTASQGTGGGATGVGQAIAGATGNVAGLDHIVPTVVQIANQAGIPPELPLEVMFIETGFSNQDSAGNLTHTGWFQAQNTETGGSPPYAYGPWSSTVPTTAQTHDLGLSCGAFCAAAAGWASHDPSLRSNLQQWAMSTQGVNLGNNPYYGTGWPLAVSTAHQYLSQYGHGGVATASGTATTNNAVASSTSAVPQTANNSQSGQQMTRVNAMVSAANAITKGNYPYSWGGGHGAPGVPSQGTASSTGGAIVTGFDCSGAVSAVMFAAGLTTSSFSTADEVNVLGTNIQPGLDNSANGVNIFVSSSHTFMQIQGQYWGTSDGHNGNANQSNGGAGWLPGGSPGAAYLAGFQQYHVPQNLLSQQTTYQLALGQGGITVPGGATGTGTGAATQITGSAEAFTAQVNIPSIEEQVTALLLGQEHKGLMHDQSLMPFVQQLTQASMRSFQSLPNGDFFAFYPDYFGEMGQHDPYWLIDDIEILDGGIQLSDDSLATHVFAVGDNTWPNNQELLNELFSAGTISIFNAFLPDNILDTSTIKSTKKTPAGVMSLEEASAFINRYGARPLVKDYPMVRSPIYEMLLAYQQFMLAWSNQFLTPFTFTFMPELYPGGKVAFPKHGLQMYINSVTHSWDYGEGGFTTTAQLSAPSAYGSTAATNPDLPPLMASAMVEPVRKQTGQSSSTATRVVDTAVSSTVQTVTGAITNVVGDTLASLGL